MVLIKCLECSKEISDMAQNCPHCGVPRIATQSQMDEVSQQKNQVKKSNANYFIIGIVVFIISFFIAFNWFNSSGCDDGTCYQANYMCQGLSMESYIWFGKINGEMFIGRYADVFVTGFKSKAIYMKRIKDKNGKTIAMDIKFPHDEFLDNKGINWNGRWECDGCNGVISPGGSYFAYDPTFSENFNWEAFWNR
jgi:hypothetical protein